MALTSSLTVRDDLGLNSGLMIPVVLVSLDSALRGKAVIDDAWLAAPTVASRSKMGTKEVLSTDWSLQQVCPMYILIVTPIYTNVHL